MVQPSKSFKDLAGEYAALANNYLDHLPVENSTIRSFDVVAEALRSITDSKHHHDVPDSLKGRVSCIQECLDNPEMYVEKRENDQQFKEIIL